MSPPCSTPRPCRCSERRRGGFRPGPTWRCRGLAMRAKLGTLYHAGVMLDRIEGDAAGVGAILLARREGPGAPHRMRHGGPRLASPGGDPSGGSCGLRIRLRRPLGAMAAPGRPAGACALRGLSGGRRAATAGRGRRRGDSGDWPQRPASPTWVCLPRASAGDLRRLGRLERFAGGIARAFPWPREMVGALARQHHRLPLRDVTAGEIRETVGYGGGEANRVKSICRVGMGRCQGRYCQLAVGGS